MQQSISLWDTENVGRLETWYKIPSSLNSNFKSSDAILFILKNLYSQFVETGPFYSGSNLFQIRRVILGTKFLNVQLRNLDVGVGVRILTST